jgi:hypothetical protein
MASPLTKIAHKTREVRQALTSNCWHVYHQATPVDGATPVAPARIYQARTQRGQFQVRHLVSGKWHNVGPTDTLYQQ